MEQNNTSKYILIGLAILLIILAVVYFTSREQPVTETIDEASAEIAECQNKLAAWQTQYNNSTSTPGAQEALDDILEDCEDALDEARENI